jgi:hypothetical protein
MSGAGTARLRVLALVGCAAVPSLALFLLLVWLESSDARVPPPDPEPAASGPAASERRNGRPLLDRIAGRLLRPGPLSASHADLEGITTCTTCHGTGSHVPDARCLACHQEIGLRAARRLPLHGTLEGACASCHPDHRGPDAPMILLERAAFQHAQAGYPLLGAHTALDCEACHRVLTSEASEAEFRYQGVPYASCASCHADPHRPHEPSSGTVQRIRRVSLDAPAPVLPAAEPDHPLSGRACESCHTEASFLADGLRQEEGFRHEADARYALRGAHDGVRCDACHTAALREAERAAGLPPGSAAESTCGGCHEDPHRKALGDAKRCGDCHVEEGWGHHFDHDRHTRFALDALHARIACGSCHEDIRFRSEGRECAECHQEAASLLAGRWSGFQGAPDPHDRVVKCAECHGDSLEANTMPALAERCVSCHAASYGPLLATWRSELDKIAARSAARTAGAELLTKSGPHNFVLARRLLDSLARGGASGSRAASR